jgi:hypothetical protein
MAENDSPQYAAKLAKLTGDFERLVAQAASRRRRIEQLLGNLDCAQRSGATNESPQRAA